MAYLSTPIGDLRPAYDVVVVGSGYGGAIAALRMLEKTPSPSVCVLERGPERQAGDFPSTIRAAIQQTQIDTRMGRAGRRTALFDMRINKDVSVLVGCGLGGTSLINAGVMLEPLPEVFDHRWPAELQTAGAGSPHPGGGVVRLQRGRPGRAPPALCPVRRLLRRVQSRGQEHHR
jgi:cholesterol oxidase